MAEAMSRNERMFLSPDVIGLRTFLRTHFNFRMRSRRIVARELALPASGPCEVRWFQSNHESLLFLGLSRQDLSASSRELVARFGQGRR